MSEQEDHPAVARIKVMLARGDFDKIDRMVEWFDALENLGKFGDLLKRFVIWSGIIAGGYFAFTTGHLTEWIRSIK